jgi:hypothetical protein
MVDRFVAATTSRSTTRVCRAGALVRRKDPRALERALEHVARAVPDAIARATMVWGRVRAEYDPNARMARTLTVVARSRDPSIGA